MLSLIAAVGKRGEIGIQENLPWHIPEDLKRFRQLTRNKTVIMGRKTFESILASLGKPLPDRKNIIITSNRNYHPEGCVVFNTLEEALNETQKEDEVFVIGGAKLYAEALHYVDRMYLTHIYQEFNADTFFPEIDFTKWRIVQESARLTSERESLNYAFLVYEKIDD